MHNALLYEKQCKEDFEKDLPYTICALIVLTIIFIAILITVLQQMKI